MIAAQAEVRVKLRRAQSIILSMEGKLNNSIELTPPSKQQKH